MVPRKWEGKGGGMLSEFENEGGFTEGQGARGDGMTTSDYRVLTFFFFFL